MSLQIWLPLNTNTIKNQGLNNTTFSINGNWFNQGKIGNTSFTNGTITIPKETAKDILNNQELTISFWIYINQEEGSQTGASICFGNNPMGENNNRKFSLFVYPTVNDLHWSWMNDAANTTFPTGASVLDDCLSSYKWTHVTVTYNNPNAKIYINGEVLQEGYGKEVILNPGNAAEPITLGVDEYFVLGDNRNNSQDSRFSDVGLIHRDDIIGRAWLRCWPLERFGILKHQ